MHIEHINISAPKEVIEELKDFYCYIFDLHIGSRPNFKSQGFWLYADEKSIIHLTESDNHYKSDRQTYFDHVAFQIEDIQNFVRKLKKFNVGFEMDSVKEVGMAQLFFKDPAGNGLEANFINEEI
jgi:glyoxylase I family protein